MCLFYPNNQIACSNNTFKFFWAIRCTEYSTDLHNRRTTFRRLYFYCTTGQQSQRSWLYTNHKSIQTATALRWYWTPLFIYLEVCRKDSYKDLTVDVWVSSLLLSQSKRMIRHRMHTTERWSQRPGTFWLIPLSRKGEFENEMQSSSDFQSPVFLLLTVLLYLPNYSVNKCLVLAVGWYFWTIFIEQELNK